jgi:hypothetical protein
MFLDTLNDTGSNRQTIWQSDYNFLTNGQMYGGFLGHINLYYANGTFDTLDMIVVEIQLVDAQGVEWSPWFQEMAVIQPNWAGGSRLSGCQLRKGYFFGTSPTHLHVSIASTKGGMHSLL